MAIDQLSPGVLPAGQVLGLWVLCILLLLITSTLERISIPSLQLFVALGRLLRPKRASILHEERLWGKHAERLIPSISTDGRNSEDQLPTEIFSRWRAYRINSAWACRSNLRIRLARLASAVRGLMDSRAPISQLVWPAAARLNTSRSRAVRRSSTSKNVTW